MPGLRLVLSRCQQESVASLVQHGLMWRGCESATLLPAPSYPARVGVEGQAGGGTKRPVQDRSSDLDEKLPADQTLPTAAVRAGKSESQASTFQAGAAAAINTGKAAISIFPRVLSRLLDLSSGDDTGDHQGLGCGHFPSNGPRLAFFPDLCYAPVRRFPFTPMFGLLCACSIWKDKPYSQCFGVNDMKCLELNDFGRNGIDQTS